MAVFARLCGKKRNETTRNDTENINMALRERLDTVGNNTEQISMNYQICIHSPFIPATPIAYLGSVGHSLALPG